MATDRMNDISTTNIAAHKTGFFAGLHGRFFGRPDEAGAYEVLIKTRTRVDVGSWLGKARLWVGRRDGRIIFWSGGPRPYRQEVSVTDIHEGIYNYVTGELVLQATCEPQPPGLKILPLDAKRILGDILQEGNDHA